VLAFNNYLEDYNICMASRSFVLIFLFLNEKFKKKLNVHLILVLSTAGMNLRPNQFAIYRQLSLTRQPSAKLIVDVIRRSKWW